MQKYFKSKIALTGIAIPTSRRHLMRLPYSVPETPLLSVSGLTRPETDGKVVIKKTLNR